MEENEVQGEINACKIVLKQTDHDILEAIEDIFAAEDIASLLRALSNAGKEIVDIIKLRKDCRTRIRELQTTLDKMQDQANAPSTDEPAQDVTESAGE